MIGRREHDRLTAQRVEVLDEAVHDALELAELLAVTAELGDRVEFIEEQNARRTRCEIKQRADVLRRASEERRDQAVEPRHIELKAQLFRNVARKPALARARGPVHQKAQRSRAW